MNNALDHYLNVRFDLIIPIKETGSFEKSIPGCTTQHDFVSGGHASIEFH